MFPLILLGLVASNAALPLRRPTRDLPHGGVSFGHSYGSIPGQSHGSAGGGQRDGGHHGGGQSYGSSAGRVVVTSTGGGSSGGGPYGGALPLSYVEEECGSGEVRNSDGSCAEQEVSRKIYVFAAEPSDPLPPVAQPDPEVNIDVILVKAPAPVLQEAPLVAPAAEQKTVVYVLSKRPTQEQQVIEVPSTNDEPEVYFVSYADGENPTLPGGIDLQTALKQSDSSGNSIISGDAGSYSNVGGNSEDFSSFGGSSEVFSNQDGQQFGDFSNQGQQFGDFSNQGQQFGDFSNQGQQFGDFSQQAVEQAAENSIQHGYNPQF